MDEWWLFSMTRGFVQVFTNISFDEKNKECVDVSYKDPFGKNFRTWQLPKEGLENNFGLDKFPSLEAAVYHETLLQLRFAKGYLGDLSIGESWRCFKLALKFSTGYLLTKMRINATKVWRLGPDLDEMGNLQGRRW